MWISFQYTIKLIPLYMLIEVWLELQVSVRQHVRILERHVCDQMLTAFCMVNCCVVVGIPREPDTV